MRNLKHYKTDHDSTALVPRNSFEKVVVETVLLLSDNDEDIVHDDKRVTSPSQDKRSTQKQNNDHNETNRYNTFQNNTKEPIHDYKELNKKKMVSVRLIYYDFFITQEFILN